MIQSEGFTPFFGKVEDVNDPEEHGKIRVRVYGYNTSNKGVLPTDSLAWFGTVTPNSAALDGVGTSPTGYKVGSFVFGYYIDEYRTQGLVIGSINGLNDLSALARGKQSAHIDQLKSSVVKGVKSADGSTWNEPVTAYAPKYPNNMTHTTSAGHVVEIDDTPGAERVKIFHKSGSLIEMHPDGSVVARCEKSYDIVYKDRHIKSGTHTENVEGAKQEQVATSLRKSSGIQQYQAPNIELGEPGALEPVVLGNKLKDWINNELVPWINKHTHTSASPGSPTSPPISPFNPGTAKGGGVVYSKKNSSQ
jgi:hypothetical protein